ncbi:DUF2202 domain-containing protein [Thermococcus thioreducens]|uniref:DUF2202 domain-containing protein n=1 Tax=Thermococcus thioreducens TaxID=277988 RepID=A0A0Q2XMI6_9EURY|nr:DUF2202 domain-containing protein [Thermococcus thioreducens]ASJ12539.1 hypothetical protein A3L14_06375 [Thermococcus thioreducens]KQH82460.1 hypothetical protein AMR53_05865 [Thermococcus thioreducens]SEV89144.1 hypothetical protein SAMN05216170_0680 [Thermococcus thioreducens]
MRKIWFGIGLIALLVGMSIGAVSAYMGTPGPNPYASQTTAPATSSTLDTYYSDLSQEEIDGLLWMVEEEKLARDVYLTLYDQTGLVVFSNIANSEQMHMDAVLNLIEKYNLTAPDTLDQVGVFQNEQLQNLYNQLVEMGSQSVVDALKVGALIEETDIVDLQERIAQTDNEDIKLVYENLMTGSENHLRAFAGQLEAYGVTYEPQVVSEDYYQSVIGTTPSHGYGGHGMIAAQGQAGGMQEWGIMAGIASAFRHAWAWMNGLAQRIGTPI